MSGAENTLQVVQAVYAGLINKSIIANLVGKSCNTIGLAGADGDLIRAQKRLPLNAIDYGYVGDLKQMNDAMLMRLFQIKLTPVFVPLTHDGKGQLLNTNAELRKRWFNMEMLS